mmetsp:Transcript_133183/g.371261  ORF Transcript_133183/g.371261 Transcript_133183/m.371261 type:complete len:366 (+) Transcript_133183:1777-2874(+)
MSSAVALKGRPRMRKHLVVGWSAMAGFRAFSFVAIDISSGVELNNSMYRDPIIAYCNVFSARDASESSENSTYASPLGFPSLSMPAFGRTFVTWKSLKKRHISSSVFFSCGTPLILSTQDEQFDPMPSAPFAPLPSVCQDDMSPQPGPPQQPMPFAPKPPQPMQPIMQPMGSMQPIPPLQSGHAIMSSMPHQLLQSHPPQPDVLSISSFGTAALQSTAFPWTMTRPLCARAARAESTDSKVTKQKPRKPLASNFISTLWMGPKGKNALRMASSLGFSRGIPATKIFSVILVLLALHGPLPTKPPSLVKSLSKVSKNFCRNGASCWFGSKSTLPCAAQKAHHLCFSSGWLRWNSFTLATRTSLSFA